MVGLSLVAVVVNIVPEVVWTVFRGGVDGDYVNLGGVGEGECEVKGVSISVSVRVRYFTTAVV